MAVFVNRKRKSFPYIKLDYIESTGTQYIDTLYNPNQSTKIVLDAQINAPSTISVRPYFSCYDGTNRYALWDSSSSSNVLRWHYGTTNSNTWSVTIEDRRMIVIDGAKATINGVEKSYAAQSFSVNKTLWIGANNNNGTASNIIAMKIHSCQIYDNGTLVRNFIPVQMKKTGEVGLWDKVNRVFYGNAGTGKFIGIKDNMPVDGIALSYIKSTGTQYIDTGFMPKHNSRVVVDISDLPNAGAMIFGARNANSTTASQQFNAYRASATTLRSDYFGTNKSTTLSDSSVRTTIDKNANIMTGYGLTITNTAVSSGTCTYSLFLFAVNSIGSASGLASYKLYSCQIYDNDTIVRDYVPFKMSDGSVGLWDKVNCEFYPNAGTGVFVAGETFATIGDCTVLDYIQSTGTQYIDTGFKPNQDTKVVMDAQFDDYSDVAEAPAYFYCTDGVGSYGVLDGSAKNNKIGFYYGSQSATWTIAVEKRRTVLTDKNMATLDDNTQTLSYTTFQLTQNLYLFVWNNKGTAQNMTKGKIYSCEIYDDDTLVRDYVPVKFNKTGEVGLFDKTNGVFYPNTGTGEFIAGEVAA